VSDAALDELRSWRADTAVVLGSGLSSLVEHLGARQRIAFADCGDLPRPTVAGHAGCFALCQIGDCRLILAQGRVHLYEGHSAQEVTAGIRFLAKSGVQRVILTNAAGAVNGAFAPGSWMMLRDHLNLTGTSPLIGTGAFADMTEVYSSPWRAEFTHAATAAAVTLHEGVYAGVVGPQYETPAEVRMLRGLGADAVGMSTVLEAIQARALGLQVAAFSCLTNAAAGMSGEPLSHDDVLAVGRAAASDFARLLQAAL
jgi:purine-nucleoside phosphorylase